MSITPGNHQPLLACLGTGGSRGDLPDPAPSAPNGQPSGLRGTPELGDSIRPGGIGWNGRSQSGLSGTAAPLERRWTLASGPVPRARSRNTDSHQGSNWAAIETDRSSGGRSPEEKEEGRLDSRSLSSLFDRGARAKRVVPEIDGEFAGHLALNGFNFSNLKIKAPSFHR